MPSIDGNQRFDFVRKLGAGGMGIVVEVIDRERNLRMALKGLHRLEPDILLRFKNEFRALRDVQHRNLVRLGELFEHEGAWFFTMELLDGTDFMSYVRGDLVIVPTGSDADIATRTIRSSQPPELETAQDTVDISEVERPAYAESGYRPATPREDMPFDELRLRGALSQLVTGLRALHAAGKVHRDVKPSNVMVEPDGRVVVVDFGVVAEVQHSERHVVGTAAYMAPEQGDSSAVITPAADWYALGCVLFQALTGSLPFARGASAFLLAQKKNQAAPSPHEFVAGLPDDLAALCEDLLERDPDQRPNGAAILRRLGVASDVETEVRSEVPFVGRQVELDALWSSYRGPDSGEASAIIIEGPSGVGKSALVDEFLRQLRLRESHVVVLSGRCHEREAVPYKAFDGIVDALGRWLQRVSKQRLRELMPGRMDSLFRVFPALRVVERRLGGSQRIDTSVLLAGDARQQAFETLRNLLTRIGKARPLVLVTDDVHWADSDSIALMRSLVRGPDSPSLMFLATARDEGGVLSQVVDALGKQLARIGLPPLPADESEQLARSLLAQHAPSAQVDLAALGKESRGHPMFIRELIAHTGRTGERSATLDDALWSRSRELDDDATALLELVAVGGTPLPQGVIADAAGLSPAVYARAIALLRVRHLVRQRGARRRDTIEPYHDRVREALYERLDTQRCQTLHGRVADALERAKGSSDLIADHLDKAGQPARAAVHALAAARSAMGSLAFDRAVRRYQQVLDLAENDAHPRDAILVELGDAAVHAGRAEQAAAAFSEASENGELSDNERRELRRRAAEQYLMGGQLERGLVEARRLLAEVNVGMPRTTVGVVARLLWHQWRLGRNLHWNKRDETVLPTQELTRIDTYWSMGAGLSMVDTPRGALYFTRGARECLRVGDSFRIARALMGACIAELSAGRAVQAQRMIDLAFEAAKQHGTDLALGYALFGRGAKEFMLDSDWTGSLATVERAAKIWQEAGGGRGWESDMLDLFKAWALNVMTRMEEVRAHKRAVIAAARDTGNRFQEVTFRTFLAPVHLCDGDPDAAAADVDEAMALWIPESQVFGNQAYFALRARSYHAVYTNAEGDPAHALRGAWARFNRSLMGQVAIIRLEAYQLRAMLTLASAAAASARGDSRVADGHVRRAAKHVKRLRRTSAPIGSINGGLLQAGIENLRGNVEGAVALLRVAVSEHAERSMICHGAAAQYRLGTLLGGDEGASLVAAANTTFTEQRLVDPLIMIRTLAPGWPEDLTG